MANPCYVTIKGERQGLITAGTFTAASVGNTYVNGHEDECLIQAFKHEIVLPRDPQSGQPTGQRVHKPIQITKIFDKSSPLLFKALTTGEVLPEVTLKLYRTSTSGQTEHYFTIQLEDAIVVDIHSYMLDAQDEKSQSYNHREDVFMTYRKIVKTHEVASTSESDDWRAPLEA